MGGYDFYILANLLIFPESLGGPTQYLPPLDSEPSLFKLENSQMSEHKHFHLSSKSVFLVSYEYDNCCIYVLARGAWSTNCTFDN